MNRPLLLLGGVAALLLLAGRSEPAPSSPPATPSKGPLDPLGPAGPLGPLNPTKPPTKPAAPASTSNPTVLVIGDSLGVGLAGPAQKQLGSKVISAAKSGTAVDAWATESTLGPVLASAGPAVVLISLGTNDIAGGSPIDAKKRGAIRGIVQRIQEAGSIPVWIGPPTLPTLSPTRDVAFRAALAAELGPAAANVPLFLSELIPFERAPDQIHATPKGYEQWAQVIVAWLVELGLVQSAAGVALRRAGLAGVP